MKFIFFMMLIFSSCSNLKPSPEVDDHFITVLTALDHAQMSYLKGCVDTHKELTNDGSFPKCRDKAKNHRKEIESIIKSK